MRARMRLELGAALRAAAAWPCAAAPSAGRSVFRPSRTRVSASVRSITILLRGRSALDTGRRGRAPAAATDRGARISGPSRRARRSVAATQHIQPCKAKSPPGRRRVCACGRRMDDRADLRDAPFEQIGAMSTPARRRFGPRICHCRAAGDSDGARPGVR